MDLRLDVFGLDASLEELYRLLLARPSVDVATLAGASGTDVEQVRRALGSLHDLGLINRSVSGDEYFAVDPRHALRAVMERHERQVFEVRQSLPELGRLFDEARRPDGDEVTTRVVSGPQEIGDFYYRLKIRAVTEFVAFDNPPYILSSSRSLELAVLDRGVSTRAVYSAASFEDPSRWADVLALAERGEQARVARVLPFKLAIADRVAALVALVPPAGGVPQALVTEAPELVTAFHELFELHWGSAVPVDDGTGLDGALARSDRLAADAVVAPGGTDPDHRPARPDERALLTMFAAGLKDETIAKQLGISSRTLRRRVQELWTELGVDNRFAAGVVASRRGWL